METHRLFIAVEPPASVRAEVEAARRAARRRLGTRDGAIRWTPTDQLHLTLHFLGDVSPGDTCRVGEIVSGVWPHAPFPVCLRGAGVFPGRGRPRVLWLGLARGRARLEELFIEVGDRLTEAGLSLEARRYHPHLTLGRVRRAGAVTTRALLDAWPASDASSAWTVDRLVLFESRLSPSGATHHPLGHALLDDSASPSRPTGPGPGQA